jgi:hypothetical protein
MLKNVMLTPREKGRILGELFAQDEILTLTQVGIVKREMDKPTHTYHSHIDSAWTMYNHITFALKESHPSTYMADHEKLHDYFVKYNGVITPVQTVQTSGSDHDLDIALTEQEEFGVTFL